MYTNSEKIVDTKVQVVPNKIDSIEQVVPDRIFSVAFHPGGEKLVAGAGDKWGKVGRGSAKIFFCVWSKILPFSNDFETSNINDLWSYK